MLRLNLSTDYALRTLLYLASRPGEVVSTREVASFYRISADHVSKVVQHLAHAGLVRAERGRNGGLRLGRPAEAISVGEVVELFEGPVALLECVSRPGVCVIQPGCRLRRVLDRAGTRLMQELNAVRLSELTKGDAGELVTIAGAAAGSWRPERE
jgi:Rrf2 family nitric oxide-sensitive transcriptional repressor